jgi:hypothetical protein
MFLGIKLFVEPIGFNQKLAVESTFRGLVLILSVFTKSTVSETINLGGGTELNLVSIFFKIRSLIGSKMIFDIKSLAISSILIESVISTPHSLLSF